MLHLACRAASHERNSNYSIAMPAVLSRSALAVHVQASRPVSAQGAGKAPQPQLPKGGGGAEGAREGGLPSMPERPPCLSSAHACPRVHGTLYSMAA